MNEEPQLHLVLDDISEVAKWRRRTAFLIAVLFEIVFIIFVVFVSQYMRRHELWVQAQEAEHQEHEHATFLMMPPDLMKELRRKPKTNILSDKNRLARGPSPKINPHGLPMPYIRGNTLAPKIAGGSPPPPPKKMTPPSAGAPKQPKELAKVKPPKPIEKPKLTLSNVNPPKQPNPLLAEQLGMANPEDSIQQSLRDVAHGRSTGQLPGPGDSINQLNNLNPNFSTSGPIILSNTRGVDFGPYLAEILMIVRQNWYAVIPEAARLGERGESSIVFEILKDGSVPRVQLVGSSGKVPLDRAAEAGIRASIPFPPLPAAFTGRHLVLQFNFFYNMQP